MIYLNAILAFLALLSLVLALWQWLAARRFPLHQRVADANFSPAISILKPLKDCDDTTLESLESWLKQNYSGQTQILFGVADPNDPVCNVVRKLLHKSFSHDTQLVVCAENLGTNAKVSTLAQLEKLAKHDLILISDADVRVPPDFLANVVALLRDEKTGLASCFYRLTNPTTTAMRLEAIAINADFWSQVLQSASLKPLDFALGAVMLTRRKALVEIGGFRSLVNSLADDYQLGHRIVQNGHRLALCPVVVECWDPPMNWRDVWKHQLRWARTIRACQPLPYFFSILSNATLWPWLWLVSELFALLVQTIPSAQGEPFQSFEVKIASIEGVMAAVVLLLTRITLAQNLQRRFTPEKHLTSPFWLVPLKDLLQTAIWLCAFGGNTVEWRGQRMKLRRDGTLVAEKPNG